MARRDTSEGDSIPSSGDHMMAGQAGYAKQVPVGRTAAEAVAARIRWEIRAGRIGPGTRLRQNEIAARFGVSTTPIREAFKLLQAAGLLRIDAHRGAAVMRPTGGEVRELYEMRVALETLAMNQALPMLTKADFGELATLLTESGTPDGDMRFHGQLYAASGWSRLCELIRSLRDASQVYVYASHGDYLLARSMAEHERILTACRAGDETAAAEAVREHLLNGMHSIMARLDEKGTGPNHQDGSQAGEPTSAGPARAAPGARRSPETKRRDP